MAERLWFTTDHFDELQTVVRDHRSQQGRRPQRRRQPVFTPSAGSQVYQCVFGTRLRHGSAADPTSLAIMEPVCLCINLGDVGGSGLRNLRHEDVRAINITLDTGGAIGRFGMIDQSGVDDLQASDRIKAVTKDQLGEAKAVQVLRTRFAPGYIGTGAVVIGNEDEAWWGGLSGLSDTTDSAIEDADNPGLYLVNMRINKPANDSGITGRLEDWIVIRDRIAAGATIPDSSRVEFEFNQQPWLDNDSAYSPDYWYKHLERGWLPVFDAVTRPMALIGKTDAATGKDTSGTISIWTGDTASGLTDSDDNVSAYNRFGDIEISKWVKVEAFPHGWEVTQAEC